MNKKLNTLNVLSVKNEKVKLKTSLIAVLGSLVLIGTFIFTGCRKKDNSSAEYTTFNMHMTDAPGDYDAVFIDVVGAEVHSDITGWASLNIKPGIYNLLDLTNGKDTLIATGQVAVGKVSQIRLILGTNNTVVVKGTTHALTTPSAQQSGLKLQVHADLVSGIAYNMLIDFDADKSIVETGSGKYMLKPVIRVITKANGGSIQGIILPLAAKPAVYAVIGTDSFSTYADVMTGAFSIGSLQPGSYKLVIMPKTPFSDSAFVGVNVTTGVVSNTGIITVK